MDRISLVLTEEAGREICKKPQSNHVAIRRDGTVISPKLGELIWNTTDRRIYEWNGSEWVFPKANRDDLPDALEIVWKDPEVYCKDCQGCIDSIQSHDLEPYPRHCSNFRPKLKARSDP